MQRPITIIILASMLLSTLVIVNTDTIETVEGASIEYFEDFDSYAEGLSPTPGWTNGSSNPDNNEVDDTQAYSGSNSMYVQQTSGNGMVYRDVALYTGNYSYQIYMTDDTEHHYFQMYGNIGGFDSLALVDIDFSHLGSLGYRDSGGWNTVDADYPINEWVEMGITLDCPNQTWDLWYQGVLDTTDIPFRFPDYQVQSVSHWLDSTEMWIDDINITAEPPAYLATVPYSEGFEYSTPLSPAPGWTNISGHEPTVNEVNDTYAHSGSNSMLINSSSGSGVVYRNVSLLADPVVSFWVYFPNTTEERKIHFHSQQNGWTTGLYGNITTLFFKNDADLEVTRKAGGGASTNTGHHYVADAWQKITMTFSPKNQTFNLMHDDTDLGYWYVGYSYAFIRSISIEVIDSGMFIDDFNITQTNTTNDDALPADLSLNEAFNDEFDDVSAWTTGGTVTATDGEMTIEDASYATVINEFPSTDSIIYFRAMDNDISDFWYNLTTTKETTGIVFNLSFNYNITLGAYEKGTISDIDAGVIADGLDFSDWNDFAFHLDRRTADLDVYMKSGYYWEMIGAIQLSTLDWYTNGVTRINELTISTSTSGPTGEAYFDYISVCYPNLMNFGDSISAGANFHDPDYATYAGHDPINNSWGYYANVYANERNNLWINPSQGSKTSMDMYNNVEDDVIKNNPAVVVLQSSNNDYTNYDQSQKETNTQNITDLLRASPYNINVLLTDAIVPNDDNGAHPGIADYYKTWNANGVNNVTGVADVADIMQSGIENETGDANHTYMESDGIHPNIDGYVLMGEYIETFFPNLTAIISAPLDASSHLTTDTITFNGSTSLQADWYNWTFGDSNYDNSTSPTTTYSYSSAGIYQVNLTVGNSTTSTENTTSISITITVPPTPPSGGSTGPSYPSSFSLTVSQGWNTIGVGYRTTTTAEDVVTQLGEGGIIYRRSNDGTYDMISLINGQINGDDFALVGGSAYLIYSQTGESPTLIASGNLPSTKTTQPGWNLISSPGYTNTNTEKWINENFVYLYMGDTDAQTVHTPAMDDIVIRPSTGFYVYTTKSEVISW